jgi:CHAT domain-containing protein
MSGLLCSDGLRLSPLDLVVRNPHPQLAFLSACLSVHALPATAGETVNTGMLFQQAGFRHTIGTLWEVNDRAYADIAVSFYRSLDSKGLSPEQSAFALHLVTRSTRSRYPHIPSLWAAHIHLGP